ncbi:DNA polymerase [Bat mastadenovirus WIV12]|uniref:DNA polymerase n=1 Tax=Bat mastadenovirus WIV12 TaxID=1788434 RepID=A0A1B0UHZ5_9ADEN|nr:DNA polymerase [Bat mastadenovirus WIV12]AMB43148.1 DNA polymerase [Bat mastadenovirus WIV12]
MALVQVHGTSSSQSTPRNSEHQQESGSISIPATLPTTSSPRTPPSGTTATLRLKPLKGTRVAQRACNTVQGIDTGGNVLEVKYYNDTMKALQNLFHVHLQELPPCMYNISCASVHSKVMQCGPSLGLIYNFYRGKFYVTDVGVKEQKYDFPLEFLVYKSKLYLINEVSRMQKCQHCGRIYKNNHTCSLRRRDFYFHCVNAQTSDWWESISFFPIGSFHGTEQLFITYDVETYTWHGQYGKQLVPFMLVFKLTGNTNLVKIASQIAHAEQWDCFQPLKYENIFFYINPQKRSIGYKFKRFRELVQKQLTDILWHHFITNNNDEIEKFKTEKNISETDELTFEQLKKLKLKGYCKIIEIYIVGHNINGFDEIVLAAQVINNKFDLPKGFKIMRNFMPRCGKILFNDITYALPNPQFIKPGKNEYKIWQEGICQAQDLKYQFVKVMVRDTYALTHTSLQNAAKAYNLKISKGCCPYQAVNDFYMIGQYEIDEDGFPASKYWKNQDEYQENKQLWKQSKKSKYDIIDETLEYCVLDVIVTSELVDKLLNSYKNFIAETVNLPVANFNIFQRPTISSNSHAIFKQILFKSENLLSSTLDNILFAPSKEMYDYVRSSIRGGRCYPTYIGVLEDPIYVYDICGMYASALTHPFPSGKPLNTFERNIEVNKWQFQILMHKNQKLSYFNKSLLPGIFTIDAIPPAEEFLDVLPPFCSKKGGRLCWTNEPLKGEVVTSIDIITLHNRGWTVTILPDERTTVFPEWKCVAAEYVRLNIMAKEKADQDKNQTLRNIAKLLSNALYGSFATKLDNKKTLFSDQMDENCKKSIANGSYKIKNSTFIETDNFSAQIIPQFSVLYSPLEPDAGEQQQPPENQNTKELTSLNTPQEHVTYVYKPITFLDCDEDDACLHTLELNSSLITNDRYPSQIASFVLAWTRAFISEWADFLYADDRGTPLEHRKLKSVYGDTDSLFLTKLGKDLMEQKGKHRIKKNGGSLTFDPKNPDLTWLVECETQCSKCGQDAYSSESLFMAPKLYALKDTTCDFCKHVGPGKLRAKGHAKQDLSYDVMLACYYADVQQGSEVFQTSRTSLRRTLTTTVNNVQPFTVTQSTLTRTLRPWKDKTLHQLNQNILIPYSNSNPNPRNNEVCWTQLPWEN